MSYKSLLLVLIYAICVNFFSISQTANDNIKKKQYLLISSGLMFSKSKVIDQNNLIETKYVGSFTVKAAFQKQLRRNLYWEANLSYNDYSIGYKLNDNNPIFLGAATQAFRSLEGSYSLKYTIQTKNNKDILNLHVGLIIGYAFSSKGPIGKVGYSNNLDGKNIINELNGETSQPSLLIIGNSIGISRDFRITNKLDIGLNFNYNFGYNKLMQIDIEYTTTNSADINTAKSILNGTSWQSVIYFRYRLSDN